MGERQVTLERVQSIQGRVLDDQGKPSKRATVHLKVGASHHTTTVAPDGTFLFDDVEEGTAVVGVSGGDGEGRALLRVGVPVVPGTLVELVLGAAAAPSTIRGLGAGRSVFTRSGGARAPCGRGRPPTAAPCSLPGETRGSRIDVFVEPTADDPRGLVALDVVLAPRVVLGLRRAISPRRERSAPTGSFQAPRGARARALAP